MAFEELMALANRLDVSAEAFAALAARLRLDELGRAGDPVVVDRLDAVVDALGAGDLVGGIDDQQRTIIVSFARAAQAGIGAPGARILDVGAGVGALAVAFSRAYPESTVVALEPWEPSLALARENVRAAGVGARVEVRANARPDATIVLGTFGRSGDALAQAISDLRTVRSGGTPMNASDAIARLQRAGLADVREIPRTWSAPVELVVGRRG